MTLFIYRKTFERLLYILALAGVGLTLHIALWYSGGLPVQKIHSVEWVPTVQVLLPVIRLRWAFQVPGGGFCFI